MLFRKKTPFYILNCSAQVIWISNILPIKYWGFTYKINLGSGRTEMDLAPLYVLEQTLVTPPQKRPVQGQQINITQQCATLFVNFHHDFHINAIKGARSKDATASKNLLSSKQHNPHGYKSGVLYHADQMQKMVWKCQTDWGMIRVWWKKSSNGRVAESVLLTIMSSPPSFPSNEFMIKLVIWSFKNKSTNQIQIKVQILESKMSLPHCEHKVQPTKRLRGLRPLDKWGLNRGFKQPLRCY